MDMECNVCDTCEADDGRAGDLIGTNDGPDECMNCYDTRSTGSIVVHANLDRTEEELQRTFAIIDHV